MPNNHWREPCEHCGKRTACPHYPAYADTFPARVRLAAECIRTGNGIGSRAFDNCFEMSDGSAVVAALEHMAARDPALRRGIDQEWHSPESRAGWQRAVARYASVPENRLHIAAAQAREAARDVQRESQLALL